MAELLLFHHAHGQTKGFLDFAQSLRQAGHTVHTPDLYNGKVFGKLDAGVAYARQLGFGNLQEAGVKAAENLPDDLVYAGFSLGVASAQKLTQTRPGARGALLFSACLPLTEYGTEWPAGVPVQIHAMQGDEFFEEDRSAAEELIQSAKNAELFLYPGQAHLFADSSLPSYDAAAAELMLERVLEFLKDR